MKKLVAGICVTFLVALMSLGLATSANAANGYPDDTDEGTLPNTVTSTGGSGSEASTTAGSGILPATGGPETLLLVGGAALIAVGGVALVATRRRA